jgi:hypothetical protein
VGEVIAEGVGDRVGATAGREALVAPRVLLVEPAGERLGLAEVQHYGAVDAVVGDADRLDDGYFCPSPRKSKISGC